MGGGVSGGGGDWRGWRVSVGVSGSEWVWG